MSAFSSRGGALRYRGGAAPALRITYCCLLDATTDLTGEKEREFPFSPFQTQRRI